MDGGRVRRMVVPGTVEPRLETGAAVGLQRPRISMFGPLQVSTGGRTLGPRDFPGRKPKQLLELLLWNRGHTVSKERLAELLWGENLPRDHVATLETYVSVLRRTLDPSASARESVVCTEHRGYRITPTAVEVDLDVFDTLLAQAAGESAPTALVLLRRALDLVRGDVLEDEPDADWVDQLRERYRDRHARALVDCGRLALLTGNASAALLSAQQAVQLSPLAEPAYQLVMLASYALWRQDEALAAFDRCRRLLADELGADPLDETVALHLGILRHVAVADLLRGLGSPAAQAPRPAAARVLDTGPVDGAPTTPPVPTAPLLADGRLPLIARDSELAALRAAMARAQGGTFTVAVVTGSLGMGKTRLVEELAATVDVPVAATRCSDLESGFSYLPLALALRPVLAGMPGDGLPALHRLLGRAENAPPLDQFRRLGVMEDFAGALAAHPPLLLWLDDAQWADPETLTTLSYLQRRCPSAPILVVLTCDRSPDAGAVRHGLRPDVRLDLGPLPAPSLRCLLPGSRHDQALYDATGGHPLFVDGWVTARQAGLAQDFPAALCERVLAACWDLGPQAYRLLCVSAALDKDVVEPHLLARLVGAALPELDTELDRLAELGWLTWVDDGVTFATPAVRAVLTHALSPARRAHVREQATTIGGGQARPDALLHAAHGERSWPHRADGHPAA